MKKILLFICLVTLALEVSASTDMYFIPNPMAVIEMTQKTTNLNSTSSGETLYFWLSGTTASTSAISATVQSAKTFSNATISSSYYSLGSVSSIRSSGSGWVYSVTLTAKVAGTYQIYIYNKASTNVNATLTLTVKNSTNLQYNNKNVSLINPSVMVNLNDCYKSSNSSGAKTYSWNGSAQDGATLNAGVLSITKPGTYNLKASQAETSTYTSATSTFTITAYPPLYHKPMSSIVNDLDITSLGNADVAVTSGGTTKYYSTLDDNWESNVKNIRSLVTDMYYLNSPTVNHNEVTELFDRNVSTRMKFDYNYTGGYNIHYKTEGDKNYQITKDIVLGDDDKFDFVLYKNYDMAYTSDQDSYGIYQRMIRFYGRWCKKNTYYALCIPFPVSATEMPDDFVFEEITEQRRWNEDIDRMEIGFQQVDHLEAGVPYLYKYTGAASQWPLILDSWSIPNSLEPRYMKAQPVNSSPHFQGTFINLIDKDLHQRTEGNPYNNGYSANGNDENTLFDSFFNDLKNGSPLYALNSNNGKIEKLGSNNSIRPFRAYFRFSDEEVAKDGANIASGAKLITIRHFSLDEEETTSVFNLDTQEQEDIVDVYDLNGIKRAVGVFECEALKNLPRGVYLLSNGKKISK